MSSFRLEWPTLLSSFRHFGRILRNNVGRRYRTVSPAPRPSRKKWDWNWSPDPWKRWEKSRERSLNRILMGPRRGRC